MTNRKVNISSPEYCSVTNLRKLIIYNVLGSCRIGEHLKKYWTIVQSLDSETTFDLYFKLLRILDISVNLETYESIQKLISESIAELFTLGWKPYRKIYKEQEEELENLIVEDNRMKYF